MTVLSTGLTSGAWASAATEPPDSVRSIYTVAPPEEMFYKPPKLTDPTTARLLKDLHETFAPRVFESADEFVEYYRPSRVRGFSREDMHWIYQQYVAIVLFNSLRWSLRQFFAFEPTPRQIRDLMLIPRHFARAQLHEYPSGSIVIAAQLAIASGAWEQYQDDPQAWEAAMNYRPQSAAEFEFLRRSIVAAPDQLATRTVKLAAELDQPPLDYVNIVENGLENRIRWHQKLWKLLVTCSQLLLGVP